MLSLYTATCRLDRHYSIVRHIVYNFTVQKLTPCFFFCNLTCNYRGSDIFDIFSLLFRIAGCVLELFFFSLFYKFFFSICLVRFFILLISSFIQNVSVLVQQLFTRSCYCMLNLQFFSFFFSFYLQSLSFFRIYKTKTPSKFIYRPDCFIILDSRHI